ncbi:pyridoxamine 5'-phosphate oxidase family protein [Curtobacterium flaccumfaciens]|nr:pyridoxamine 5'-phosphate oxidase family protein [Curtobacterium flaccumfaciens]
MRTTSLQAEPSLTVRRLRDRQSHDPVDLHAILAEAIVAHVGFVRGGHPIVLPFLCGVGDLGAGPVLLLHGSTGGGLFLDAGADGVPVSATVTHVDGLVFARSTFDSSANYRSAVVLGTATVVPDERRADALRQVADHLMPGRRAEVREMTAKEVRATQVLQLPLDRASVKIRAAGVGEARDDGEDHTVWAGVLPLAVRAGAPIAGTSRGRAGRRFGARPGGPPRRRGAGPGGTDRRRHAAHARLTDGSRAHRGPSSGPPSDRRGLSSDRSGPSSDRSGLRGIRVPVTNRRNAPVLSSGVQVRDQYVIFPSRLLTRSVGSSDPEGTMGRHALPAAPDGHESERAATTATTAPAAGDDTAVELRRPRGRRSAFGPAVARSTFVEHAKPARSVSLSPARPVASTAVAGSAVLSRSAALRAERAVDPRHVRRAANAKRAAILLAPALAVTSSLTLAVPANAATPSTEAHHGTTTSQLAQTYTVARDVQVPVVSTDGMTTTTTIVSYPTIVTKFGVSTQQAEDAISKVLSAGATVRPSCPPRCSTWATRTSRAVRATRASTARA